MFYNLIAILVTTLLRKSNNSRAHWIPTVACWLVIPQNPSPAVFYLKALPLLRKQWHVVAKILRVFAFLQYAYLYMNSPKTKPSVMVFYNARMPTGHWIYVVSQLKNSSQVANFLCGIHIWFIWHGVTQQAHKCSHILMEYVAYYERPKYTYWFILVRF